MEKIIFRNFLKDITNFFIYSLVSIALIVWIIQAVNYLDFVSEDGHSFKIYLFYTILNLPKIISRILPFIFFISIFYTILKYEENNELLIFWINGINKKQFLNKILKYASIFLLIQLALTTFINPKTQDMARSFIRASSVDFFPSLIKEKKFIDTVSNLTIFVDKKIDNELTNIILKDKFNDDKSQLIYAKKGLIFNADAINYLILYDGKIINTDNGKTTIFSFEKTKFNLSNYATKSTLYPKFQELKSTTLLTCLYSHIKNFKVKFDYLECDSDKLKDVYQEVFKRFYLPIYLLCLALIASLIILFSKDVYNYNKMKISYFLIGMFVIVLSNISVKYSTNNDGINYLFFILPILIFSVVYIYFIKKTKIAKK